MDDLEVLAQAAGNVAYEIQRMVKLGQVPQLRQIEFWRDHLIEAMPAEAQRRLRAQLEEEMKPGG